MNRTMILALLVVTMALLLAGGVVLAKGINCPGGLCTGTKKPDSMVGTAGVDEINGRGGGDQIFSDVANGPAANDTVRGGRGDDILNDQLGQGNDVDTIFGGKGDDTIAVKEGDSSADPDFVDCGPGTDTVFVDPTDTRLNCEIFNPS